MKLKKVLIAFATRYGSTKEVAEFIAEKIKEREIEAEISNIIDISSLEGYDAVIIGSPIYMGKWLKEGVHFVQQFSESLNRVPVALFSVGATLKDKNEKNIKIAEKSFDVLLPYTNPVMTGLFAGKIDKSNMNFVDKQILKIVKPEEGDFRNFDEISVWTDNLIETFRKGL